MDAQPQIQELPGAEAETGTQAAPPDPPVAQPLRSALCPPKVSARAVPFSSAFIVFGF